MSLPAQIASKASLLCIVLGMQACTGEGFVTLGADPGPAPLRRLTNKEFDNTVADLLGGAASHSDAFPGATTSVEGYDNFASGLGVSATHAESLLHAAEAIATRAVSDLQGLLRCDIGQEGESACVRLFIAQFGERAFRRPLTEAESRRFSTFWASARESRPFSDSVRLTLEAFLLSPAFLYRVEHGSPGGAGTLVPLTSWEMASRLSYFLIGSMPDEELFRAARADELTDPAHVEAQARRLLDTARARDVIRQFSDQWLELRGITTMQRSAALFEGYDDALRPLFKEEANRLVDSIVWDTVGDMRTLFSADYTFLNERLAMFYGVPGVTGGTFVRVHLDSSQRKGLLTLAGVLAAHGKPNETLPARRGRFIRSKLFCTPVSDPPPGAIETAPQRTPGMTVRDFFTQVQREPTCAACHSALDGVGFGLESYNAVGQWRDTDHGRPVDATGVLLGTDVDGPYTGGAELADRIAESRQVTDCIVRQAFRFANGRMETDADQQSLAKLNDHFESAGFNSRELLIALTQSEAFLLKRSEGTSP
ncbi:MAG: DUF1592 domain-containing protein [Myxococcaceae bacterium]